jgi:23S rRNA pseudouridine1911/1915/1917 synthase
VPSEEIPEALAGERIDRVVSMLTTASRAEASVLIAGGHVTLNGAVVTGRAHRVAAGDLVAIDLPDVDGDTAVEPDPGVDVEVVYEDDDIVVIDKQPGLVVHPGAGNKHATLVHGLVARFPEMAVVGSDSTRPGIVHRLDKETSGLLVAARSEAAYGELVRMLTDRRVDRSYLTLAWGDFEAPSGAIEAPIGRSSRDPTRMTVSSGGKEARTRYDVVQSFHEPVTVTLLRCHLETGRTHQIRVHLSAIGHPVVGDARYGGVRESLATPRIFLHATELAFAHPVTNEPMHFESPLPADLRAVLEALRERGS